MAIQDTDIFVVQRGEQAYKMPATQLNDYVDTGGGEPSPSTDTLTDVCNRGSSPATSNRNMQVNGNLTSSATIQGNYVVSDGDVKANSSVVTQNDIAIGRNFYNKWNRSGEATAAIYEGGNAFFARRSGSNGAFIIGEDGVIEHRAAITTRGLAIVPENPSLETGGSGTILCQYMFALNVGSPRRILSVNSTGWVGAGDNGYRRTAATNIEPIDTSNFIAALKAVNLHIADHPVQEDQRQFQVDTEATTERDVGLFVEDVEATAASSLLLSEDANGKFFDERRYSHFLFGVCKEQQALIENLTARVAALEADHTAAMSNMGDSSY